MLLHVDQRSLPTLGAIGYASSRRGRSSVKSPYLPRSHFNGNSPYLFAISVATDTTEDDNGLLVYQAAPTPIFRESCLDHSNAPALAMVIVRTLGGAVNHSVAPTGPCLGAWLTSSMDARIDIWTTPRYARAQAKDIVVSTAGGLVRLEAILLLMALRCCRVVRQHFSNSRYLGTPGLPHSQPSWPTPHFLRQPATGR